MPVNNIAGNSLLLREVPHLHCIQPRPDAFRVRLAHHRFLRPARSNSKAVGGTQPTALPSSYTCPLMRAPHARWTSTVKCCLLRFFTASKCRIANIGGG